MCVLPSVHIHVRPEHRRRSSVNFRHFCPKKCVVKINKMPEFYMILARKISKNTRIFIIFARKFDKIPEFNVIFARKMPEFYIIA